MNQPHSSDPTPDGATDITLRGFMIKDETGRVRRILGYYKNGSLHLADHEDTGLKIGRNPRGVLVAPMC